MSVLALWSITGVYLYGFYLRIKGAFECMFCELFLYGTLLATGLLGILILVFGLRRDGPPHLLVKGVWLLTIGWLVFEFMAP